MGADLFFVESSSTASDNTIRRTYFSSQQEHVIPEILFLEAQLKIYLTLKNYLLLEMEFCTFQSARARNAVRSPAFFHLWFQRWRKWSRVG